MPAPTVNPKADPAFWNNLAEQYAAKPVDDPAAFERKIQVTRDLMGPDATVLDIGCGTGSLALRLADAGHAVHGLDLSSEMVRIARTKTAAQGVDNVHFHVGPFDDSFSAFSPGTLDGICAYSILHLLEDRVAALTHIHRMLKPGGFFVSSTVCLRNSWVPFSLLLPVMRWLGKAPWVWVISTDELVAEIEAAGFIDVEVVDVGADARVAFVTARRPVD